LSEPFRGRGFVSNGVAPRHRYGSIPDCAKLEIQRRLRTGVPADGQFLSTSVMFVRRIQEAELTLTP